MEISLRTCALNSLEAHANSQMVYQTQGTVDSCLYRYPTGEKCAIGHGMSDEDYDRLIYSSRALSIDRISGVHITDGTLDKAQTLQQAHDIAALYPNDEDGMRARCQDLGYPYDPNNGKEFYVEQFLNKCKEIANVL